MQVIDRSNEPSGQCNDHIVAPNSSQVGLRSRRETRRSPGSPGPRANQRRAPLTDRGNRVTLATIPNCRRQHVAVRSKNLLQHPLGRFRRNREAQSLGHRDDRRVDADHEAARIDQRPARIAGVDRAPRAARCSRSAGHRGLRMLAAQALDHAGRDRRLQAERAAHRDHELTDAERIAESPNCP